MHRPDAATVSYTRVRVAGRRARMEYIGGPPCRGGVPLCRELVLGRGG
ncbi:MAG: hypothetical protein Q9Q13_08665 [Acidobacteriota bacterium]|nr:hypothetical protein [Acidobacteriota bacterium]